MRTAGETHPQASRKARPKTKDGVHWPPLSRGNVWFPCPAWTCGRHRLCKSVVPRRCPSPRIYKRYEIPPLAGATRLHYTNVCGPVHFFRRVVKMGASTARASKRTNFVCMRVPSRENEDRSDQRIPCRKTLRRLIPSRTHWGRFSEISGYHPRRREIPASPAIDRP